MTKLGKKILGLSIITALISITIFIASYFYIFNYVYSDMQVISRQTVEDAAKIIDGDKLSAIVSENNMDSESFKSVYDAMIKFKADSNVRFLYTFRLQDDNNAAYIVDAAATDAYDLGETYPLDEDMKRAFNGEVVSSKNITTDEDGTLLSAYAPVKDSSGKVVAIVGADQDVAMFQEIIKMLVTTTIFAVLVVIAAAVVMALNFSKKLSRNMSHLKDCLGKMAAGDLSIPLEISSNDEIALIAADIEKVRKNSSNLLSKLKDNSNLVMEGVEDLSSISSEMSASTDEVTDMVHIISKGAANQAKSLNNIAGNLTKFGGDIDAILDLTEDADSKVKTIDDMAQSGNVELHSLVGQLSDIKDIFRNLSDKIMVLSGQIEKISDITGIINGVADQTNLLALNAAIEASRAGEAGRGFSVVADEIRKLSEQSKDSSQQINELIKNISSNSREAVTTTEDVSDKLNNQVNVIETSLMSFRSIIDSIEIIVPKVKQIKDSAISIDDEKNAIIVKVKELTKSADEAASSAEAISQSVETVNTASRKVAGTAENLNVMAKNMIDRANKFKL